MKINKKLSHSFKQLLDTLGGEDITIDSSNQDQFKELSEILENDELKLFLTKSYNNKYNIDNLKEISYDELISIDIIEMENILNKDKLFNNLIRFKFFPMPSIGITS